MKAASVRVAAPGKMLLTGSYAVLRGAPAIVCAVDRYAIAGPGPASTSMPEVESAFDAAVPPELDVAALAHAGMKLGLGSSAAAVVAALGYRAAERGADIAQPRVRRSIFLAARAAHAKAQRGGSGVDVAASVHGGWLHYAVDDVGAASISPIVAPSGLRLDAYFCGRTARTSEMLARVDALAAQRPGVFEGAMRALVDTCVEAAEAARRGDALSLVPASQRYGHALAALGRAADAPIVLFEAEDLAVQAESESAAFVPSGAGGGDVFVRIGTAPPTERFDDLARSKGFLKLDLGADALGVRVIHALEDAPKT